MPQVIQQKHTLVEFVKRNLPPEFAYRHVLDVDADYQSHDIHKKRIDGFLRLPRLGGRIATLTSENTILVLDPQYEQAMVLFATRYEEYSGQEIIVEILPRD